MIDGLFAARGATGPDVVYELRTAQYCSFHLDLETTPPFEGAVSLRAKTCAAEAGGDECLHGAMNTVFRKDLAPGTHWVIVDGDQGTAGEFTLTLRCDAPTCGDGIQNLGEDCDPGVPVPGDGCTDPAPVTGCKFEAAPAADTCAAAMVTPIPIIKGQPHFLPETLPLFNTATAADDYVGTCSYATGSGPDQVFAVIPNVDATLEVIVGRDYLGVDYCQFPYDQPECWNYVAWIRTSCTDTASEKSCTYSDTTFNNGVLILHQIVQAGVTYYVFVEGDTMDGPGHSGPYLLSLALN